ncbi:succinyl-diaminopimelate desuccinylase [Glycomyces sp. TRM65418]|uniref:succinyl-diaminopimelate desuccinylase n=1 Tax=Glycomyces sp. TRM65418 TaxID=2867006 RepID=UPI001CE616FB|nr:succinyl-diaminopimelate desuccinylase [Glycomyces sp. TRM65418]MCC3765468.1 succinyl-diaminopimelate desuccinylase [Glycomyces sp. TRM65418]QZD55077.1 succinyl-diaminopimelate desuccinylase [Glycomyces sp. TRM65418]
MTVLSEAVLADPVALTRALCDIQSVSWHEAEICDEVETALKRLDHLTTERIGNTLVARTDLGRERRVMLAGHLDTVPVNGNFPTRLDGDVLWGLGTADMKSGTALALWIAATVADPKFDLSFAFYDCEEIEAEHNGLNKLSRTRPELLAADFAILLEPTYGLVEAGCQGTMRARVSTRGKRAHSARSWKGENAIHRIAPVLERLNAYRAREVEVDGCAYREGLNAVFIGGGVAGNVIPDECWVEVNFRFAPDRDEAAAEAHLREVFAGYDLAITDSAPSCRPGLDRPEAADFVAAAGGEFRAKLGWTDVARFATLGIPAVNFGPGDPNLAHKQDERVEIPRIRACADALRAYVEES